MAELGELRGAHDELVRHGGTLMAISVDPPDQSRRVRKRLKLPYPILADRDRSVIKSYGLLHPGGGAGGSDTAVPAHVLVGPRQTVLWRRSARLIQDRPSPAEVLSAIQTNAGTAPNDAS